MIKKLKKTAKIVLIATGILIVAGVIIQDKCNKPQLIVDSANEFKLPVETYRPPIVKIPFKRYAQPVAKKNLPIPTKDIDKTITIGEDVVIVIDKKGKVYTTKDTPKDIPVKVTVWKPKALAFESKWGITLAMTVEPDMYFCLSWSFFRVGGIHLGADVGIKSGVLNSGLIGKDGLFLGIAGRYRILKKNEIYLTGGYEFTHKTVYIGITVIF